MTARRYPVLIVVTDGLGYSPATQKRIAELAYNQLSDHIDTELRPYAGALLHPIHAEALDMGMSREASGRLIDARRQLTDGFRKTKVNPLLERLAAAKHYVPWTRLHHTSNAFRNRHLSVATLTSGVYAGLEELNPPIQGNSETGHQNLANLTLAKQLPTLISEAIANGTFQTTPALRKEVGQAVAEKRCVNFAFMLSGIGGDDGHVHSAWSHLRAFLELVFSSCGAQPDGVRMLAILDGRDSSFNGSVEPTTKHQGYLYELHKLLATYGAVESLAWVVGRSYAMDRDYQEHNLRATYELLWDAKGLATTDFGDLIRVIKARHGDGYSDSDVLPLVVGRPRRLSSNDLFVNLNFRSDRQRALTAALLGEREFLKSQSQMRGRLWNFDWLRTTELRYCALTDYNPSFSRNPRYSVAFPRSALKDNLLKMYAADAPQNRYLLVAESVKASHMGYFVRGRLESPSIPAAESRIIVPSYSKADDVNSDSEIYKRPTMRNHEVARLTIENLDRHEFGLVICNLAASDMVGHLLPKHFDAALKAYADTLSAALRICTAGLQNGYAVIWTSDHGNIELDAPSHGTNPVTTTVALPAVPETLNLETYQACLNDIAVTAASLLGIRLPKGLSLAGRSIVV